MLLYLVAIRHPRWPPLHPCFPRQFFFHCKWIHKTCQQYFSNDSQDMLFLFGMIQNPGWPSCRLIGKDIMTCSPELMHDKITRIAMHVNQGRVATFSELLQIQNSSSGLWLTIIFFTLLSQTTGCQVTRLSRNIPLKAILNSRWLSGPFIVLDIYYFLSRTAPCHFTRLSRRCPLLKNVVIFRSNSEVLLHLGQF